MLNIKLLINSMHPIYCHLTGSLNCHISLFYLQNLNMISYPRKNAVDTKIAQGATLLGMVNKCWVSQWRQDPRNMVHCNFSASFMLHLFLTSSRAPRCSWERERKMIQRCGNNDQGTAANQANDGLLATYTLAQEVNQAWNSTPEMANCKV